MYPKPIFLGMTLYDILICVGIIACFIVFDRLADIRKLKVKFQKFCLICGMLAITLGFGSAILFQAVYNIPSTGRFEIVKNTGATFYGGLIGGVATFLLIYFTVGLLIFKKTDGSRYHTSSFFTMASCAVPSIVIAHAFGRLGCLAAGCCHGALTDKWYGIVMHGNFGEQKYVPVQLFEALFLFALFTLLFLNAKEGKRYNLSIYMSAYGAWRFFAEYMRSDYRGSVGLAVTPSQLIAILMIVGSVAVFFVEKLLLDRRDRENAKKSEENGDAIENKA